MESATPNKDIIRWSADLAGQVEGYILHLLAGRIRGLHVIIGECGVILQGQSHTYYAKQLAQHAAMEISHLPIFANEIEVT